MSITPTAPRKTAVGALLVIVGSILFGTLGTVSVLAYQQGMTPPAFAAWREAIGALGLLILLAFGVGRPKNGPRFSWRNLSAGQKVRLGIAAVAFMVFSLAIFYAFDMITVALALLIFYMYPALVTLISGITGKERFTVSKVLALLLALAGSLLAVMGGYFGGGDVQVNLIGVALAALAAIADTVYFLVGRDGYPDVPPIYATTFFLVAGTVVFALIALFTGGGEALIHPLVQPAVLPILIFAGIFGAAVPTVMILSGIRIIGSSRAAILALTEPVAGVVIAMLILSQPLLPVQIIGGVLVLVALLLLQLVGRKKAAVEAELAPAPVSVPEKV
jgi:DME family drug/metabolite transporter